MESREIRLARRPEGRPALDDFAIETVRVPAPEEGQVRVRNLWMSVDPYMAARMYEAANYVPPFKLGRALDGACIGEVVDSADPAFTPGDLVSSNYGWREAYVAPARRLMRIDAGDLPPQTFLGLAGITGLTAYVGLFEIGKLDAGEVVYISAAAGAVGSAACQMAKIRGATVIGSAGGADKIAELRQIGVDHAIDYKATDLKAALNNAAPDGIDLYFDNVGGPQLEAALGAMKNFGRIASCGMISQYAGSGVPGPDNMFEIIARRLTIRGFLVMDHPEAAKAFERDMRDWIGRGLLQSRETIEQGIASAPAAFLKLFQGANIGKMLVKLAD